tara:strand:- start:1165 stop:1593 length:429 start_codon:yes stop_codon:yes gene_type:complete
MDELTFKLPVDSITEEDMNEVIRDRHRIDLREHRLHMALKTSGILNDIFRDENPKKCICSDGYLYAFVYYEGREAKQYGLWVRSEDNQEICYELTGLKSPKEARQEWGEVTDLTGVTVYTYQMLKEIAVSIGWIDEDSKWLI